ncbi:MAG: DUF378 domain-containing protein [Patescibacteria group bacterium]|jgi:hypothetical protein
MKMNIMDWIAFALVIIGGLNWGLIGILDLDVVEKLFGDMSTVSRIIYSLVGVSALYLVIAFSTKCCKHVPTQQV